MPNVLITGCSSGIGRALADAFKAAGYHVLTSARREADVIALNDAGFHAVLLDVNDSAALQTLATQVGELDVLINN
ncbi:MAG TPA: short-chain dehydrogenase, partial [Pseudomonas sp.]|nr:short-chain dehydrogenase [Pseudomonas sp.]